MILTKKDKILAGLIVFFLFFAFLGLAWLSRSGNFSILADALTKGL